MAYYRKNKRRFDPRYFMNERMEELEEYTIDKPPGGPSRSIMDLDQPPAEEEEEEEEEEEPAVAENCGDHVEAEEDRFSFTGDVGDLSGESGFGVGWAAALDEVSSMIAKLIPESGEDEDADPVGDQVADIEELPQMIVQPPLEE